MTAALRIALSFSPTDDELAQLRNALPAGTELVSPAADQVRWSRFDCSPDVLTTLMSDADALFGWAAPTVEAVKSATRLRFVAWLHAGCDQLELRLLAERGVRVANVRGANSVAVAEHAMGLLLGLAKRVRQNDTAAREVRWQGWWDPPTTSIELEGKSVCVLGFGNLGRSLARMCGGFGMTCRAIRRSGGGEDSVNGVEIGGPDEARAFMSSADFVILAMPLTPETRNYINAERLAWLNPSAFLINVARGDIVEERALHDALVSGALAGFGCDVWWSYQDVMPPGYHFSMPSRLGVHRLPNVLASTDSAANVLAVKERMFSLGLESLSAWAAGREVPRLVDPVLGY